MMVDSWYAAAALMVALLLTAPAPQALHRVRGLGAVPIVGRPRIGVLAVIAQASAHIRSGGSIAQAFGGLGDDDWTGAGNQASWFARVLSMRALARETPAQIDYAAVELALSVRCSERLGCELVRCLDDVADSYRAWSALEELKANALAMPQATVKLLSLLPIVTVLLGEVMGARPVAFLLGSRQGLVCLVLGGAVYAFGMVWVRSLLRGATMKSWAESAMRIEE
ncbi:MAG: pilus assembly protein [Bifidobacterium mongoliense]|jgi:tight adherence protein B|uniref:type II secretion system F family protein n=1 Tax=Bifidobacterium mongoliense TaxID=518643 RepID=UPI002F356417